MKKNDAEWVSEREAKLIAEKILLLQHFMPQCILEEEEEEEEEVELKGRKGRKRVEDEEEGEREREFYGKDCKM